MENSNHFNVIVIGAGISGIGAGYYLKKNCPNKVKGVVELKLCDRYSIPTKLLETILKSAIDILT